MSQFLKGVVATTMFLAAIATIGAFLFSVRDEFERGGPTSIRDIISTSGRAADLPDDILEVIKPGVKIDYVVGLLGSPTNSSNEHYGEIISTRHNFEYDNARLTLFTGDDDNIHTVVAMSHLGAENTSIYIPKYADISLDLVTGVTTWNSLLSQFTNKLSYEYGGRWNRIYVSQFFGLDGDYLIYGAGSHCELPTFSRDYVLTEDQFLSGDYPAPEISDIDETTISFVMVSNHIVNGELRIAPNLVPTSMACQRARKTMPE